MKTFSRHFLGLLAAVGMTASAMGQLTITNNPALPVGKITLPYSVLLGAVDGTPPYTWLVISNTLPPGLSLDPATGLISGTPTTVMSTLFRVQVTDTTLPVNQGTAVTFALTINECSNIVSTAASPAAGGVTHGDGTNFCGTVVTVTAVRDPCYTFDHWTVGTNVVSTESNYTFMPTNDIALVAHFTQIPYTVTTSASPAAGGTIDGVHVVGCGNDMVVATTANACYNFLNWTEITTILTNGVTNAVTNVVSRAEVYDFVIHTNRALVANFVQVQYTIAATNFPAGMGTITGAGVWPCGTNVTVTANPAPCYQLAYWTDHGEIVGTSTNYTFIAATNRTLVANYTLIPYTITTRSSGEGYGTTSGGGVWACGTNRTVTATPANCFTFVDWMENGVEVSTSPEYTFTASADRLLTANFSQNTYAVNTSVPAGGGGTTSGGGVKVCGTRVDVVATPDSCYQFVNWTEGGEVVGTSKTLTFGASADRNLVANFSQITNTITTSVAPVGGGSASGGSVVPCGTSVTVTATTNPCYQFVNWTESGTVVSTSSNYTFTASGSRNLVANFSQGLYGITTSASPSGGGITGGGGNRACGSSVTVTATPIPNSCYQFVNWTEGGLEVSTSASYTFTAGANRTLVANFSRPNNTITVSASPAGLGSVGGGGLASCGTSVTVTATPNEGDSFLNWTEGATVVSGAMNYTFTANGDRTLVANFTNVPPVQYTVATSALPATGGSTSGGGSFVSGATATVTAIASNGFNFVNWTEGGNAITNVASFSFTVSGNRTLVAHFGAGLLGVSATEFVPVVLQGKDASTNLFGVWNAGAGTLNYTISSNVSWLAVDPPSGSSSGSTNSHTVSYSTATLSNGTYDGTITIGSSQAANSPRVIGVTLYVADAFNTTKRDVTLKMKMNFAPGKLDTANLKTVADLPLNLDLTDVDAQLSIGSVTVPFKLSSKGSGKTGFSALKLQRKGRPTSSNQLYQVTAKLKGDLNAEWANNGLVNATTNATIEVPVLLFLDNNPPGLFYDVKQLQYKAKKDSPVLQNKWEVRGSRAVIEHRLPIPVHKIGAGIAGVVGRQNG